MKWIGIIFAAALLALLVAWKSSGGSAAEKPVVVVETAYHSIIDVTGSTKSSFELSRRQFQDLFDQLPDKALFEVSVMLGANSEIRRLGGGGSMRMPERANYRGSTRQEMLGPMITELDKEGAKQAASGGRSCILQSIIEAAKKSSETRHENVILFTDAQEDCEFLSADGKKHDVVLNRFQTPEEAVAAIPKLHTPDDFREKASFTSVTFVLPQKFLQRDAQKTRQTFAWLESFWKQILKRDGLKWKSVVFGDSPPQNFQ